MGAIRPTLVNAAVRRISHRDTRLSTGARDGSSELRRLQRGTSSPDGAGEPATEANGDLDAGVWFRPPLRRVVNALVPLAALLGCMGYYALSGRAAAAFGKQFGQGLVFDVAWLGGQLSILIGLIGALGLARAASFLRVDLRGMHFFRPERLWWPMRLAWEDIQSINTPSPIAPDATGGPNVADALKGLSLTTKNNRIIRWDIHRLAPKSRIHLAEVLAQRLPALDPNVLAWIRNDHSRCMDGWPEERRQSAERVLAKANRLRRLLDGMERWWPLFLPVFCLVAGAFLVLIVHLLVMLFA